MPRSGCAKTSTTGINAETERAQRRAEVAGAASASARKPASASTNSSFPNSDGWKVKKPTLIQRVEPRAARPTHEDDRDQADRAAEDRAPVAPVEIGVDEDADDERDAAHRGVDDLPVEVVARVAGDVEPRHAGDRPRARRRRARRRRRAAASRASAGCRRRASPSPRWRREPRPLRSGVLEHQSEWIGAQPAAALTWKNVGEDPLRRRRRRRAAVAAVLDHGADDDRRGRVGRPVAAPPRLVLEAGVARQRDDLLGRAGLAGDRDGELAEDAVRGAERQVRPLVEALLDDLERRRVDARTGCGAGSAGTGTAVPFGFSTSMSRCGVTSLPPFAIIA